MPERWSIRLTVEGDLRFFSHHDLMRAMERIASRAKLPLRYSQGFNPRPILSLPCPRPVGVAARDDVLVLALDESVSPEAMIARLNEQAPKGMKFLDAHLLPERQSSVQASRMEYQASIDPDCVPAVEQRLLELQNEEAWLIERRKKSRRRGREAAPRMEGLNVKPMVAELGITGQTLHFACIPHEEKWAKPGEILHLLGLQEPQALAGVVRTKIHHDGIDTTDVSHSS